jgi:hypothetical protein
MQTLLTLSEAARRWGKSRQTLYEHNKGGRLSFSAFPNGEPGIDYSEMLRAYGEPGSAPRRVRQDKVASAVQTNTGGEAVLSARLDATLEMLEQTRQELAAARDREQRLLGILEQQTRLLEHRPEPRRSASKPAKASARVDKKTRKGEKKAKKGKGGKK